MTRLAKTARRCFPSLLTPRHSLLTLADALRRYFEMTSSINDLEEAILLYRESLFFSPVPHPNRFESLNGLAIALGYHRFRQSGSMTDLEEAISLLREALSLDPDTSPPDRLSAFNNLAVFLETRFKENGNQSDLKEAFSLRQEILAMSR